MGWLPDGTIDYFGSEKFTVSYGDTSKEGTPCIHGIKEGSTRLVQKGVWCPAPGITRTFDNMGNVLDLYYINTPVGSVVRKELINGIEAYRAWFDSQGRLIRDQRGNLTRKFEAGKWKVFDNGIFLHEY